jgi:hypothetical protein
MSGSPGLEVMTTPKSFMSLGEFTWTVDWLESGQTGVSCEGKPVALNVPAEFATGIR